MGPVRANWRLSRIYVPNTFAPPHQEVSLTTFLETILRTTDRQARLSRPSCSRRQVSPTPSSGVSSSAHPLISAMPSFEIVSMTPWRGRDDASTSGVSQRNSHRTVGSREPRRTFADFRYRRSKGQKPVASFFFYQRVSSVTLDAAIALESRWMSPDFASLRA